MICFMCACPVVEPDDVEGIARTLEDLFVKWQKGVLKVSDAFGSVAADYSIEKTTGKLHELLEEVSCLKHGR